MISFSLIKFASKCATLYPYIANQFVYYNGIYDIKLLFGLILLRCLKIHLSAINYFINNYRKYEQTQIFSARFGSACDG